MLATAMLKGLPSESVIDAILIYGEALVVHPAGQ